MKEKNSVRGVRIVAGFFVFTSALLGFFFSKYWLLFTMFVGLNLFQFGFTNWCPLEKILKQFDK
ncbi:DUF2892 domain-containing protein [Candidatus Woesearchaeota archaeon]|nr:DUF2892 domain-containing protein [Nanoarchaeota archaeon]MCB9370762.1 DUF2892 domain-containing protein [Candidatus Woesearchaeota archaeon]USN43838.1 MAG: DUF2892 domain-containing protein [Candidatus Woesearchaeota archaeon]